MRQGPGMTRGCPSFVAKEWKPTSGVGSGRARRVGLSLAAAILLSAGARAAVHPFEPELDRVNAVLVKGETARGLLLAQDLLRRVTEPSVVAMAAGFAQCALRQLDRLDEITPMYEELLKKQPENWGLVRGNAVWQLYGGQFAAALEGLKKGPDPGDPSDPVTVPRHLAMCYVGLGKLEDASRCFSRACGERERGAMEGFSERLAKTSDPAVRLKFVREVILSVTVQGASGKCAMRFAAHWGGER
jgi:hypothetical protein